MANQAPRSEPDTSSRMPRLFWVVVGISTLLAIIILLAAAGRGYLLGREQVEAQQKQQVAVYLQRASDLRADGDPRGALAEYRRILELDASNQDALAGIDQLLVEAIEEPAAPTATPTLPPPPTPTPLDPLATVWADAQRLYREGRWEEAILRLRQIGQSDPNFEADGVEEMLYTALVSLGTEKSNSGSLEEAVQLYDQALEIRSDSVEIRTLRDRTADYVDALTYWYADWPRAIEKLESLYARNPAYRDVRQRLQKAHLEYGESLSRQGEWCQAAAEYEKAIEVQNSGGLAAQLSEYETLCEQAESEAMAADDEAGDPIEDPDEANPDIEANPEPSPIRPPAGLSSLGTGRILYSSRDEVDGRYRIWAQPVTVSVSPVFLVEDAMQPDLRPDGARLAFRSMRGDQRGLGSFDPGTDLRLRFTVFSEDMHPSWNEAGNRLVFASNREGDRRWRLYVAWADGNDNGESIAFGEKPAWHPDEEEIVYRGCDSRGNGCGLRLIGSGGGESRSLTTVPGDDMPTWSPDGRTVIFMSQERHGNWELYRVDVTSGAVVRLTTDPGIDALPTVSPDGRRVAFLSNRDGGWKIWVVSIDGGAAQLLAPIRGELPDLMEGRLQWVR